MNLNPKNINIVGIVSFFLQRYAFLLKDARNFGKMLEGEEDKKKKVYPRLPDVLGKKDTPYYIIVLLFPFLSYR